MCQNTSRMIISGQDLPKCRSVQWKFAKNSYTIIWSISPFGNHSSFRLFYCGIDLRFPGQCKGSTVDYIELSRNTFSYTFNSSDDIGFSVSPIYGNHSPGMTWGKPTKQFPDIILLDVEPVTNNSVRIYWTSARKVSKKFTANVYLKYLNVDELQIYKIAMEDSEVIDEKIFSTEVKHLKKSSVSISEEKMENGTSLLPLEGTCCPASPNVRIDHIGSTHANFSLEYISNVMVIIKHNEMVIEQHYDKTFFLENLTSFTEYFVEVESFIIHREKKLCQENTTIPFKTKSLTPGKIIIKEVHMETKYFSITCEADGFVDNHTIYELTLTKKIYNSNGIRSQEQSFKCFFRIVHDCDENSHGYDYSIKAINQDREGPSISDSISIIEKCKNRKNHLLLFGILVGFLILSAALPYLIYVLYQKWIKEKKVNVDLPKSLTHNVPIEESQKNGPYLHNFNKMDEVAQSIPLVELRLRPNQNKDLTDIALFKNPLFINTNDSDDDLPDDGTYEVINAQIHQVKLSNSSTNSIPEAISRDSSSSHENLPAHTLQETTNKSVYYKLSDIQRIPEVKRPIHEPAAPAAPIFFGYIPRQGFNNSSNYVMRFPSRSPQIHQEQLSNSSTNSIPEPDAISTDSSSSPENVPTLQETGNKSVYYQLSDIQRIPEVKRPTHEPAAPMFSGYIPRQGFNNSSNYVTRFTSRPPEY
ncbi:uncharacterized protein LOC129801484 [Phlebotomus papatasi]|uniref:uncharacterized protein LOC129801484 n=1 Tax=Phlebotomus papatasi TaxID=29031 RepID=UPI002483F514|nr:uncharacterized protein LOC129801484 [Phlebotomus papatasi]